MEEAVRPIPMAYQLDTAATPQFFNMSGQGPAPVPGHNMPVLDVAAAEQFMDSCQQQGLQIPAAIRSALRTAAEASQKAQSHTKYTSHRLPHGVRSKQRKVAFSDEVVEISDEEASFSPHPAQLRLDVLIPGPKEAFYTMRQRRNHRRAVLWRLLRSAPWRSAREQGELSRNNSPSAVLTSEPNAVLMAASTEPGSTFLCTNARPLNSGTLKTEQRAEPGYDARPCT